MKTAEDSPSKPDLMIIDDELIYLELMEEVMRQRGYQVRPFPRGHLALVAAREAPPDLILLDIEMPEMNGYEVCERCKADPRLQHVPVLFMSASSQPMIEVKAFAVGGVDFVSKPFQFEVVDARIRTHLELGRLRGQLEKQKARLTELNSLRERHLAQARERLNLLDKAKSDFLGLVSHELRTPLCGLFGAADMLFLEFSANPVVRECHEVFERSRRRILTLFEDALLLTLLQVDGEKCVAQACSLDAALANALKGATDFARCRAVSFGEVPGDLGYVYGEPGLLARALQSVLETSVKFSESTGTVRLRRPREAAPGKLLVEATGRAIPDKVLPRFFTLLAVGETITPGGDLGLAPAVAQRVISLFGGTLTVVNLEPPGVALGVSLKPAPEPMGSPRR